MRERLLDATIDCLYELGYSGTTTIEVAARAGVSRGAQLHHFPTKEHLVTLSVRHLLARRLAEFRDAFAALPADADKYAGAVDIMWEKMSSRTCYAWLELVVAARTDVQLRETVAEIDGQFLEEVRGIASELFSPGDERLLPFPLVPVFVFAALQGLALDRIVWGPDDPRIELILRGIKSLSAASVLARTPSDACVLRP